MGGNFSGGFQTSIMYSSKVCYSDGVAIMSYIELKSKTILVTGVLGFIGSNLERQLCADVRYSIANLDAYIESNLLDFL